MKYRISYLDIVKVVLSILIIYVLFFAEIKVNNMMLYGAFILSFVLIVFDAIKTRKIEINNVVPKFDKMLVVYGLYSFFSGLFVVSNLQHMISSLITYFAFLIICLEVCYVSYRSNGIDWVLPVITVAASLGAIYAAFWGYSYRTEGVYVITLGPNNNPNTLGLLMVLGVYSIVARKKKLDRLFLVKTVLVLLMLYVTLLSGSRKSMISAAILFVFWIINIHNATEKGSKQRVYSNCVIVVVVLAVSYFLVNSFSSTSGFTKLLNSIYYGYGITSRDTLARRAIELWIDKPFFGVGFNQYTNLSGYGKYSHSIYTEVLSCSGIIGAILFFVPILIMFISMIKRQINIKSNYDNVLQLGMLIVELVLGVGNIYIYYLPHLLIFSYLSYKLDFPTDNYSYSIYKARGQL